MRLKDKVIIVTGGATGIGRAYGQRAAEEGARTPRCHSVSPPEPYAPAAAIRSAVRGREAEILKALGIPWDGTVEGRSTFDALSVCNRWDPGGPAVGPVARLRSRRDHRRRCAISA